MKDKNFARVGKRARRAFASVAAAVLLSLGLAAAPARAQGLSALDRDRARGMLDVIKGALKSNYYDATFRGMDVEARFKAAKEKIDEARSLGQAFAIVAQALVDLNDSHTVFLPPPRAARVDYGWRMQIVGDRAFIVAVRPGSDAEAQGVKEGDEVLSLDGFRPNRDNLWKMTYRYFMLAPAAAVRMEVQPPGKEPRTLDVKAKVTQLKRVLDFRGEGSMEDIVTYMREQENAEHFYRHRYYEDLDGVMIWKMPGFDLDDEGVDRMMNRARKHKALVLDLRGNGGGYIRTLERLASHFFERDVKIADLKARKARKPITAKGRGADAYKGQLVVLVDSRSGSSAELFARLVQLEKRGRVIGDRSAGAVMQARLHPFEMGAGSVITYAVSITDADLIMGDGK
ncbi:MAG TPA: S41 family peptidase, partial [Pyrinomonadaceae bacterium]|nr:S41 family peptidase [Pyrinomonadaceae bacterium]